MKLISLFLKFDPDFNVANEQKQTPLEVCQERTLSVMNLRKAGLKGSTKTEGRGTANGRESRAWTTEKSLVMSSGSDSKFKKKLSFRKKLVDVI